MSISGGSDLLSSGNTLVTSSASSNNFTGGTPEALSTAGVSGVAAAAATTLFVDDAQVSTRDESTAAHRDQILYSINDTQSLEQSIVDYLMKPIVIHSGSFSTSDTYSFFDSYSQPYAALTSAAGAMYLNKLKGYYGISMDMRFRMVINATKFQQGRYMIGWTPTASSQPTTSNLKRIQFNELHNGTLVQRTTIPHVEIDISTGTSAELLVPFASPNNFYPLSDPLAGVDSYSLGWINVYPYSPLVSPAGSVVATYTLYISFENVRLFGAASPQSGLGDREVANKYNGPISSVTNAMSKGFKEFSSIPLLSSYANSISWVFDRASSVASIFGFNKPIQGDCISKVQILNACSHTNVDGDSDVRTLSLNQKPGTVQVDGLFGTDFDEMDFSYIVQKSAWYKTQSWALTDVVGTLVSIPVGPSYGAVAASNTVSYTPVAFVSSCFFNWRGSLVYRFKFVKTEFHSGRLSFAFYPTDEVASYTSDPYYVNRVIVDVRETTEVELTIPFIHRNMWQQFDKKIGVINIDIVDPLVAPATVSSTIDILIELAGGKDFEVSIPKENDRVVTTIVPQSGLVDKSLYVATIGNTSVAMTPLVATATCVGDKITNFRAYLKRFSPTRPAKLAEVEETTAPWMLNAHDLRMPVDYIAAISGAGASEFWITDMYGLVASCYGMVKGGIRVRNVIDIGRYQGSINGADLAYLGMQTPTVVAFRAALIGQTPNPFILIDTYVDSISLNDSLVIQTTKDNNTITVEVPQYTSGLARSTVDMLTFQNSSALGYSSAYESTTTRGILEFILPAGFAADLGSTSTPGYYTHNIYRSAAEDTSFGVFISVPPLRVVSSTSFGGFY